MSDVWFDIWYLMSDVWCLMSDIWCLIWCLVWQTPHLDPWPLTLDSWPWPLILDPWSLRVVHLSSTSHLLHLHFLHLYLHLPPPILHAINIDDFGFLLFMRLRAHPLSNKILIKNKHYQYQHKTNICNITSGAQKWQQCSTVKLIVKLMDTLCGLCTGHVAGIMPEVWC